MLPLAQFIIAAHRHHITEQAQNDLHVLAYRTMATLNLPQSTVPMPGSTLCGLTTKAEMRYMGQPARHFPYEVVINGKTQTGLTDQFGVVDGIELEIDQQCKCQTKWFKVNESNKDKDFNSRLCDGKPREYTLTVFLPEKAHSLDRGAIAAKEIDMSAYFATK